MNYVRGKWWKGENRGGREDSNGPFLDISPGDVEEAVHFMKYTGEIDLSELRFFADHSQKENKGEEVGVESFLDIAIFEVPEYCTSQNCDLSRFGIGEFTQINGMPFLGLCKYGRLIIDNNIFQGKHSQLMVPNQGSMPSHIKSGSATFKVTSPNRSYDVMIANCNDHGRHVHLTGGVVFSIDADDSLNITPGSLCLLTAVALGVCLLCSFLTIRIDRGTRADWEYQQFQNFEAMREDEERQRLQGRREGQGTEQLSSETQQETDLPRATVV
jgi:hypothetical protein